MGSQGSGAAGPAATSLGSREVLRPGPPAASAQDADVTAETCKWKSFPAVNRLAS